MTKNDDAVQVRKRPALVWVISLFYFIFPLVAAVGHVALYFGVFPVVGRSSNPYRAAHGPIDLTIGLVQSGTVVVG
ncbi:MAG TPA: hypothetical protein VNL37_02280, partial [Candidatus Polarisedimenticolia bacterium]|nr:hypothetical protein [Candidatus Polarisedimenticolia bacterium]